MAKKFGKRAKNTGQPRPQAPQQDPRNMFGPPPLPRQAGNPASSTPLTDHLRRGAPGVDENYVVLPRSLAESMSLPWQQQMANLLGQFHQTHGGLSWPAYRVVPSRRERLVDLDEEQLDEAGYLVEIDASGEMVYRERSGRKVDDPEQTVVLVPCLDPIAGTGAAAKPPTDERPAGERPAAEPEPQTRRPAPMNVGPQPVWPAGRPVGDAAPPARAAEDPEPDTPSSGLPVQSAAQQPGPPGATGGASERGWFDELQAAAGEQPSDTSANDQPPAFGPTGEPTEIPYRYRR